MAGGLLKELHPTFDGPTLGVARPIDHPADPGMADRAGAHGARFQSDEEFQSRQAIIADFAGRFTQGDDLRMSGGIGVRDGVIGGFCQDQIGCWINDQRPHGRFTSLRCGLREGEGSSHKVMITGICHVCPMPRQSARVKSLSEETPSPDGPRQERIAKALAHIGVASRREAERLIEAGRISVNGKVLDSPAFKVGPGDEIALDGVLVGERPPTRLWRYHKPEGLLTTHKDPEGRETVFERMPEDMGRVISVGRLDLNSEGLLLMTNDGELARVLELPATAWTRRYRVRAYGNADEKALASLSDGVTVDGVVYGPMEVIVDRRTGANVWLTVGLREGKNREVRKVLAHVGLNVNRLMRVAYGPFQLGSLGRGEIEEVRPAVLREQLGKLYPLGADNYPADAPAAPTTGRAKAKPKQNRPAGQKAGWAKAEKKSEPGHKARKRAEKAERAKSGSQNASKTGPKAGAKPGSKGGPNSSSGRARPGAKRGEGPKKGELTTRSEAHAHRRRRP